MGGFRNRKSLGRAQQFGKSNTFGRFLRIGRMGKRANPMAVKAALTYDINEAAAALGKTPATIRSWIKDGLPVMSSRKPYLLSGESIRFYLRGKYKAAKRPLGPDDFFCPGCGGARRPVGMAAIVSPIKGKTALLKGECSECGCTCTRMISKSQLGEFAQRFQLSNNADSEP